MRKNLSLHGLLTTREVYDQKVPIFAIFYRKYSYSEDTILTNIFNTITQNKCT